MNVAEGLERPLRVGMIDAGRERTRSCEIVIKCCGGGRQQECVKVKA
jgi:hypothetical protein